MESAQKVWPNGMGYARDPQIRFEEGPFPRRHTQTRQDHRQFAGQDMGSQQLPVRPPTPFEHAFDDGLQVVARVNLGGVGVPKQCQ